MPSAKKQKTARDSGIFLQDSDSDSSDSAFESVRPHKNDTSKSARCEIESKSHHSQKDRKPYKPTGPALHDYICIHRPFFDVEGANWLAWSTNPSAHLSDKEEVITKLYKPIYEKEEKEGIHKSSPSKHPEHKWVMMWDAWLKAEVLGRKAKYCDPNAFGMSLYNDWKRWGMEEIVENLMIEFDEAFRSKSHKRIEDMWTVVSAMGLWFNEDDRISALIGNEGNDTTCELIGLFGCALLTVLAAIEGAGELKSDSRFLDLSLVIAYYLELSHDLPAYGIEGECVAWRKEAVGYFRKGGLDPERCLFATRSRIELLEKVDEPDKGNEEGSVEATKATAGSSADNPVMILESQDADKENIDPEATKRSPPQTPISGKRKRGLGGVEDEAKNKDTWKWAEKFKAYKDRQSPKMGGTQYDITKMSRSDREAAAFDGKDPLARVAVEDLKENPLDLDP